MNKPKILICNNPNYRGLRYFEEQQKYVTFIYSTIYTMEDAHRHAGTQYQGIVWLDPPHGSSTEARMIFDYMESRIKRLMQ